MNKDEQVIWGLPISFLDFVLRFLVTPNLRRIELVPKADPLKFYAREKVAPPSQDLGEIRDANKERVNKSLSNYASNNFLLSTSNIRPDLNGKYNPGLGLFAGDLTALALSMGFDPFNASNYYKVATQIPKFRNWGLTRLLANELNNEVRVAGELGKNVGSVPKTLFIFPLSKNVTRTVQDNGKIRLSLPSHTDANPRQFVLEPLGNNKFYVHMRTWDGDHIPANLSNEDKLTLFQALYDELPEGGEILFPKSGPGYYGTRGTVAGLQRLSRDPRFIPGTKGTLQYLDKNGSIKTFEGTSFIKSPTILQEPSTSLRFFTENPKLANVVEKPLKKIAKNININLDFGNLSEYLAKAKAELRKGQTRGLAKGEEDVFNYLGSERHIKRIQEKGKTRKEAEAIATEMRNNAMATDYNIGIPISGSSDNFGTVGEYDFDFGNVQKNWFGNPKYSFRPKYTVREGLSEYDTYRNVLHELGGHGASMGYRPNMYEHQKALQKYEDAMQEWFPHYKEVYNHNSSLKPIRKTEYINSNDSHLKYLEGVDEYSARARAENIKEGGEDFAELYKYFTKESVDKLKKGVWTIAPIATAATSYVNQLESGGNIIKKFKNRNK